MHTLFTRCLFSRLSLPLYNHRLSGHVTWCQHISYRGILDSRLVPKEKSSAASLRCSVAHAPILRLQCLVLACRALVSRSSISMKDEV